MSKNILMLYAIKTTFKVYNYKQLNIWWKKKPNQIIKQLKTNLKVKLLFQLKQ